jgi:hypothetical protein
LTQLAAKTAALRRHGEVNSPLRKSGGVKSPLRNADLKVGATIPLSYRVEDKMRLAKDHRSLKVNHSLTLGGIPPETFEYRLGNRSALEWVIDQYQVTEDKHSGIRSDPNRPDDPNTSCASWAKSFGSASKQSASSNRCRVFRRKYHSSYPRLGASVLSAKLKMEIVVQWPQRLRNTQK